MVHVESIDEEREKEVIRKLYKAIVWYHNKTLCKKVVLHSFAHLSEDKSNPIFAKNIIEKVAAKLRERGLEIHVTPFGYFLELELWISDEPISRVFKVL